MQTWIPMEHTRESRGRGNTGQGMNWIRPAKRLAIYLRDGLACVWCGVGVEDKVVLTLDHLRCYSNGGTNHEGNLVTCCKRCNSVRGTRPAQTFARDVAAYLNHGVTAEGILKHVRRTRRRKIDVPAAKALIARRGGFAEALKEKR